MTEINKNNLFTNRFRLNVTAKGLANGPAWSPIVDPDLHASRSSTAFGLSTKH
ncbi:hypothetical protein [Deinococcus radiodurans]|jgi:hypothetical protein|uniref:hypothetical protein n=1 Tax=Deinococcus radiodurans TaxID=1299 RepID=UPI0012DD62BF|nr:hypothetical protein [Deinococcus radiodurans]QIP27906.1 hypothetical protein HAV23_00720 [Deinococcus radiodurans]QIP31213.1 hypothetical protein HAV35_02795 [Deinococcus radiodurans]UTA51535.1 hypothetical protein MSS93_04610 [Deinococcus radiodurans]